MCFLIIIIRPLSFIWDDDRLFHLGCSTNSNLMSSVIAAIGLASRNFSVNDVNLQFISRFLVHQSNPSYLALYFINNLRGLFCPKVPLL